MTSGLEDLTTHRDSIRRHPQRVGPPPLPVASPLEEKATTKDSRPEPAPAGRHRDIAVPLILEDLEVDVVAPSVDDPVFEDPGAVIALAERPRVFLHRA